MCDECENDEDPRFNLLGMLKEKMAERMAAQQMTDDDPAIKQIYQLMEELEDTKRFPNSVVANKLVCMMAKKLHQVSLEMLDWKSLVTLTKEEESHLEKIIILHITKYVNSIFHTSEVIEKMEQLKSLHLSDIPNAPN